MQHDSLRSPAKLERLSARCRLSRALQRQMCAWGLFWKGLHCKQQGMENGQAVACLCKSFRRLLIPFPPNDPLAHGIYCRIGVWCSEHVRHSIACDFYSMRKVWAEKPARIICISRQEDPADGESSTSALVSCGPCCWPPIQALKCPREQLREG